MSLLSQFREDAIGLCWCVEQTVFEITIETRSNQKLHKIRKVMPIILLGKSQKRRVSLRLGLCSANLTTYHATSKKKSSLLIPSGSADPALASSFGSVVFHILLGCYPPFNDSIFQEKAFYGMFLSYPYSRVTAYLVEFPACLLIGYKIVVLSSLFISLTLTSNHYVPFCIKNLSSSFYLIQCTTLSELKATSEGRA